jgi:F0F1-type ATP synthase assembly protein I
MDQQPLPPPLPDRLNSKDILEQDHRTVIKGARNALFTTAGLVLVSELIGAYRNGGIHPIILAVVVLGVGKFLLLASWSNKKPFHAILTGLLTFICINLFAVVVYTLEEKTGFHAGIKLLADGLILKLIILLTLLIALSRRKALLQTQRQLTINKSLH